MREVRGSSRTINLEPFLYHHHVPEAPIYLDHHATTPCDPRVVEAMLPYFTEIFGNPASLTHEHGRRASTAVENARISIARFFGVQPNEITFTAGATESNNIALNILQPGDHLVTSAMEHKSVLGPAKRFGEVTIVAPDSEGFVRLEAIRAAMRPNTRLVSVEAANGEIGTIQDIDEIGAFCRSQEVLFHSDITQALGKVPVSIANVDLASFSAHKFYGPKGTGGLYARRGIRLIPVTLGGGQERNARSGTLNVAGAVGMAAALRIRGEEMASEAEALTALRNELWDRLTAEIEGVTVHGPRERRLPGNLNVSFARIDAASLIVAMRHFSLSAGSACSSGEKGASPVLNAIGVDDPEAHGALRVGLGKSNTRDHIDLLLNDLKRSVARLREISAA
jgi:cysteine desulfurase